MHDCRFRFRSGTVLVLRDRMFRILSVDRGIGTRTSRRGRCGSSGAPEVVGKEEVEGADGEAGTSDDVDEVVVREVHGRPVQHACVRPYPAGHLGEEVRDEQRFDGRTARVEGREGTEDDGRVGKRGGVTMGVK